MQFFVKSDGRYFVLFGDEGLLNYGWGDDFLYRMLEWRWQGELVECDSRILTRTVVSFWPLRSLLSELAFLDRHKGLASVRA